MTCAAMAHTMLLNAAAVAEEASPTLVAGSTIAMVGAVSAPTNAVPESASGDASVTRFESPLVRVLSIAADTVTV